jgi:hypothetical protein
VDTHPVLAARLLGAADTCFTSNGYMREPFEERIRSRAPLRTGAMTPEAAVEHALASID